MVKPRKKQIVAKRQASIPSEIPQFNESRFRTQVAEATESVKRILPQGRKLKYIGEVDHTYADKFLLAEYLANSTLAALLNCFEQLGINEENLKKIQEWVKSNKTVTIRFSGDEKCSFLREKKRVEEPSTVYQTEYSTSIVKGLVKRASKIFTTLTDYYWRYDINYELSVYPANQTDSKIILKANKSRYELITSSNNPPREKASEFDPVEANITWLVALLNEKQRFDFHIDRDKKSCRTPRRNKEILSFFDNATKLYQWFEKFNTFFYDIFNIQASYDLDMKSINDDEIFVPITPFVDAHRRLRKKRSKNKVADPETEEKDQKKVEKSLILSVGDMNEFLQTQKNSILSKFEEIKKLFPKSKDLIAVDEVCLRIISLHAKKIIYYFTTSLDSIENLLESQLIAAIGKSVSPIDFREYMNFHYRKLFLPQFQPTKFAFPVRRPNYSPEGMLSIELFNLSKRISEPITTIVNKSVATKPMKFPLNASSNISFLGERYLHSYIDHQFSTAKSIRSFLVARAKQFSSFILLVGRIASIDLFEPKYAIIVENKDEIKIPLDFDTIPSAKEFKEAIVSLSKEHQDFSKAYRAMQLESTLFAVCIIQIKPLLEKVLNLPAMSLTKEIKLTQELFNLFNNFQIPSDLLSFEGDANLPVAEKIQIVKKQVKEMNEMIHEKKEEEIQESKMEAVMQNDNIILDTVDCLYDGMAEEVQCVKYCESATPQKFLVEFPDLGGPALSLVKDEDMRSNAAPKVEMKRKAKKMKARSSSPMKKESKKSQACEEQVAPLPQAPIVKNEAGSSPEPNVPKPTPDTNVPVAETNKPVENETKEEPEQVTQNEAEEDEEESIEGLFDYTQVPGKLESLFEKLDAEEGAIRPTIINPVETWSKTSYKNILASSETADLVGEDQERERNRAFDLLDALTKSGAITVDEATLHVVVAATHCFDKSIMQSLVLDNINPIQKVERTALIISSVIQQASPGSLVKEEHIDRIRSQAPELFDL